MLKKTAKILLWPVLKLRRDAQQRAYKTQKSVLEKFSRLSTEDPVLFVEEFGAEYAFDARSNLFARVVMNGSYEPGLVKVCLSHIDPDRDFIDVGSNIGFFSVLAASKMKNGRVLAIEPMPNSLGRLKGNLRRNKVEERVTIFEGAVSDHVGTTKISYIEGKEEFSSIVKLEHPAVAGDLVKERETPISTIDHLVAEFGLSPAFIKVDAEGSEELVFKGASETLKTHRPVIISELSDYLLKRNSSSADSVVEFFKSMGYVVCDPSTQSQTNLDLGFGEILCVPEEKFGKRS